MDREQAIGTCRRAVELAESDDVLSVLSGGAWGSTRFANNVITQNVAERREEILIRVAFGKRRGEVITNRLDDDSLKSAVARVKAIAKVAPEDEEHMAPVEPAALPDVPAGDAATRDVDPAARAGAVARVVETAGGDGRQTAGVHHTGGNYSAFANSRGAKGYHADSVGILDVTTMTGTSSGWASDLHRIANEIEPERTAGRSRDLAVLAEAPREVDPGEYTVVLGPAAVMELFPFFFFGMDAKAADEGRSALTGKEGARIGSGKVTVRSKLNDPVCPGRRFDGEGVPARDVTWIEEGVLRHFHTTRYWADHTGREYTTYPGTLTMDGTDLSVDDLIARVDRGLYVTRFWYTRYVDPMRMLLTGMTRDALFLIENGRIVSGVKHLRYNDSLLRIFKNVVEVGRPEPVRMYFHGQIPPLLVKGFRFTSKTSF